MLAPLATAFVSLAVLLAYSTATSATIIAILAGVALGLAVVQIGPRQ